MIDLPGTLLIKPFNPRLMANSTRYVSVDTTPLYATATSTQPLIHLLWGDTLHMLENSSAAERIKVKARGVTGFVKKDHIGDDPLLEYYFIDVGQGDGVLIVTPDRKHILIDGGYIRRKQLTKRNAADFVDWKFDKDYGMDTIVLDVVMSSHNDEDHYGGLWDIINPDETKELALKKVSIDRFYYAGMNWFEKNGQRNLGPFKNGYWTPLLNTKSDLKKYLPGGSGAMSSGYTLQGQWKDFISLIVKSANKCERISQEKCANGYLRGFEPAPGKPGIRILAPIEEKPDGKPALKKFSGGNDINTNGHSLLLRVDYGKTRVLLTGDLNAQSQKHILQFYHNNREELSSDIAKACHHGSDDCSFEFLAAISPSATIISSGDSEGHNHPRPKIVAASALTGNKIIRDDRVVTPLIYSTEIARSYKLTLPEKIVLEEAGQNKVYTSATKKAGIRFTSSGQVRNRNLWQSLFVSGIVYGLVNVRTDGNKILCATLSEKDKTWDIETFMSRF
jgi:beta-lactamase superfamily II metal-dependent hydrolase